ncbi:MAG: dipeptide ABC transporter ATP-binding protein [Actinobacteria bacterium]|jgi:oligopeptide/dipeptide ABC transporter ATP-binding protein|nr:dipeptide ABC transporter ATP-binding protein [Actinomycetota bacterium]
MSVDSVVDESAYDSGALDHQQVGEPLLRVRDLVKDFPIRAGVFRRQVGEVQAVSGVSFDLFFTETLGVVGESGCGKSTLGRSLLRLLEPTSGTVMFGDEDVTTASKSRLRQLRSDLQMVFQDPYASLNPRLPIRDIVGEPLQIHGVPKKEARARVDDLLTRVGLLPEHGNRYPHEFSGGQRQRIGIARSLALRPKVIVLDEPVSALDVSIQAQVLNLLDDIKDEYELSYIFIAHDLSVVRHTSNRVAVMYLGRFVETADRDTLYGAPAHPYTQSLLSAVPVADPRRERARKRILLQGDVPSPANPPTGCRFHPRCPIAQDICKQETPELMEIAVGHQVACHFALGPGETLLQRTEALGRAVDIAST